MKPKLPCDAIPQVNALIKDFGLVQDNINGINEKGIGQNLEDAVCRLTTVGPKLKDPKLRSICTEIITKIKPVEKKFESVKANFTDIFTLEIFIRNTLEENFGGGCGESSLPEGTSSSGNSVWY